MKTQTLYKQGRTKTKESRPSGRSESAPEKQTSGVIIGKLVGFSAAEEPLIAYDLASSQVPVAAISVVPLLANQIGVEVVLSFAANRDSLPVVMGVVQQPDRSEQNKQDAKPSSEQEKPEPELKINGEKINISAAKEIQLTCGKSSITLTEKGKILIKGEHILSRASGANRVRGGSIQLN